ncbi:MAG: HAD hydrolase-like protein [Caldilineaceae bacterium]
MKYKLIIFDFDGTLADSFPQFLGIANTVAEKYKFKQIQESELETLRGYSSRAMLKHLHIPLWKLPWIIRDARKLMTATIAQTQTFAGVDQSLRTLAARGIQLALVTSNSEANVRCVLGPANAALIKHYECGVALFGKASRFHKTLKQLHVLPSEAIAIGDELRDAEAAQKAKIAFGAVAWGYTNLTTLQTRAPAEVFMTVDEIIAKIGD